MRQGERQINNDTAVSTGETLSLNETQFSSKKIVLTVIISALGYFVDIYDLLLFSVVRISSLKDLGVASAQQFRVGVSLINAQMAGLLIGGVIWGVLGDKRGRKSVLFGSIILYSLSNIANSLVHDINTYIILRFIVGIGLAGELGAAVTLISEVMDKRKRGLGPAIIAGVGLMGGIFAGMVGKLMPWRAAFIVGGLMGLVLLALRTKLPESSLFIAEKKQNRHQGDLKILLQAKKFIRYLRCILIGIPVWFAAMIVTFAPEFATSLNVRGEISISNIVLISFIGSSMGDLLSGFLSQWTQSRKKILFLFMAIQAVLISLLLSLHGLSNQIFYFFFAAMGVTAGYWAVFVTTAAELFGTNIRSSVTTTIPNFVRAAVIPITLALRALQSRFGIVDGAFLIGGLCFALAFISLLSLEETFGKDLNFLDI